jgi:hypothetical protein
MLDHPHLMLPTTVEERAAAAAGGGGWLPAQLTLCHHRLRYGVLLLATPAVYLPPNPIQLARMGVLPVVFQALRSFGGVGCGEGYTTRLGG